MLERNFYIRGDGTRVYFYTCEEVEALVQRHGFMVQQLAYDQRLLVNRKNRQEMQRCAHHHFGVTLVSICFSMSVWVVSKSFWPWHVNAVLILALLQGVGAWQVYQARVKPGMAIRVAKVCLFTCQLTSLVETLPASHPLP